VQVQVQVQVQGKARQGKARQGKCKGTCKIQNLKPGIGLKLKSEQGMRKDEIRFDTMQWDSMQNDAT
jgi:hypothetical protein